MKMPDFVLRLTDNLSFKLLSVAAAVLLYFSYQIVSLDSKSFSIPLQVREGGNFVVAEDTPQFVRVTVRGKPEQISAVQKTDIKAYIDTAAVTAGGKTVLPVQLELKDYFTLMEPLDVQVKPQRLDLTFERNAYKSVSVKPFFLGSLPDGYGIVSQNIEPENIKIAGAESAVKSVDFVYTGNIDIQDKTESFTTRVKIENNLKRVVLADVKEVSVTVEIKAQMLTLSFLLSAQALNLNERLIPVREFEKITMVLSGPKNILSSFSPDESVVQADFTDINAAGTYSIPLRINIPDEFSVISIDPPELKVELEEKALFIFPSEDFQDATFGCGNTGRTCKTG